MHLTCVYKGKICYACTYINIIFTTNLQLVYVCLNMSEHVQLFLICNSKNHLQMIRTYVRTYMQYPYTHITYVHTIYTVRMYVQTLKYLCKIFAAFSRDFRTLLSAIFPPLPIILSVLTVVSPSQQINMMLCCFFKLFMFTRWAGTRRSSVGLITDT